MHVVELLLSYFVRYEIKHFATEVRQCDDTMIMIQTASFNRIYSLEKKTDWRAMYLNKNFPL